MICQVSCCTLQLFGLSISPNVRYRVGWGIPFVNRVKEFSIDGVDYDKLPPLLLVGTNGYIAPYFWRSSELSHGFMKSIPLDGNGVRIAKLTLLLRMQLVFPLRTSCSSAFSQGILQPESWAR